jgi:rhomboid protease GluP
MSHPLYQQPEPQREIPPIEEERPRRQELRLPGVVQRPYVTYALLLINIALFALSYLAPQFYEERILIPFISYTDGIVEGKEFYRLFTAMFLHANLVHIGFNMLVLYQIGSHIERYFGHLRFLLIYILGGLLGSLAMLFVSQFGLGASGAIFAIFGAQIVFLYRHRELFGAAGRAQMWSSIRMVAINLFIGVMLNVGAELGGRNGVIGVEAHVGGAIGGAIMAWFIAPYFVLRRVQDPQEGQLPVYIEQANRLSTQIVPMLVYMIGLAGLLYLSIRLLA